MPFYLVTQISLIEAEDENAAAQKSIEEIRSGKQVKVTVKSDEASASHILVAAKSENVPDLRAEPESEERDQAALSKPLIIVKAEKNAALKRIMKNVLNLVNWRL